MASNASWSRPPPEGCRVQSATRGEPGCHRPNTSSHAGAEVEEVLGQVLFALRRQGVQLLRCQLPEQAHDGLGKGTGR